MTQEQIIELLNKKIKEIQKKAKQDHNYINELWRDYYSGVIKGLRDAQNIIGMLDNKIMTQEQIIDAGINYTMSTRPVCIGGSAFEDMIRRYNRNPSFEAGATWAKENLIKEVIKWMTEQVYQEYSGGPLERLITDDMIDNFKEAIDG